MKNPILKLKKHEDRRIRAGHLWIYSNEIDTKVTPLSAFESGQVVQILSSKDEFLGSATVNPHSLICARLFSREHTELSVEFFELKLKRAKLWREELFSQPFYRLFFAEGDELPGVVVDRYGDVFVVQITTAGMELQKENLLQALKNIFNPTSVLWRNDSPIRTMEHLPLYVEPAFGDVPAFVELEEHKAKFSIPMRDGQKTGWFYDQRENRELFTRFAKGARVLDVCSYLGAWGIEAMVAGAESATCVESSAQACTWIQKNAALNGCEAKVRVLNEDAFEALQKLKAAGASFSLIVLDPPAFIKRQKDVKVGWAAYRKLNQLGLELLEPGGLLFSASCSMHLSEADLMEAISEANVRANVSTQLIFRGQQAPDHPVNLAIPETRYLKMCVVHRSS